jgi:hypothetical protein
MKFASILAVAVFSVAGSASAAVHNTKAVGPDLLNAVRAKKAVGPDLLNAVRAKKAVGPDLLNAVRAKKAVGIHWDRSIARLVPGTAPQALNLNAR